MIDEPIKVTNMRQYQIYFKTQVPLSGLSTGDYLVISEDVLDELISGGVVYGSRVVNGVKFTFHYRYSDLSMIVQVQEA